MDTKKLRQKILDLAIRGKLVPQDPNDEPASVLLERIKAEKERLIKEGKIKRSKKTTKTSDTPHYPYLLPNGWEWCKLEDIVSFGGGKTPAMDNKEYWHNGNHLWVTSKDMKCSHITNSLMKITDKALEIMTIYERGTLLVVTRSGILRHTLPISILETPATVNQDLKAISPHIKDLSEYLYIVIKANEHFILKEYHKDGTTVDSIDFDKFKCLPIPLAPITEQRRIIAETKHWFTLIEQINQDKSDLQTIINQIKNKILSLAIHGKLVPQDPNDEPASELLKRINPKAEITCDNAHYTQLPKGWSVAPMQILCSLIDGNKQNGIERINLDVKYLRGERDYKTLTSGKYISAKSFLILVDDENSGEVFKTPIEGYQGSTFKQLSINENMNSEYLLQVINFYRKLLRENKVGSAIPHLNKKLFKEIKVSIPPYREQQRIVDAINKAFMSLDTIMENL
ncbi:restriction endonuclease subunit S [Phocaeicola plebeius]|uniref:restriction endonuclease subunit S n=1 Tax=Phocaeicola plebeius TaxID=310297 RepID=UPI000E527BCC|nr:restriction endonuclease subunit S [Phocaeicola plebeius]RGR87256.1 restriction endonuclease subunit S [Phocaeicola plebeius]